MPCREENTTAASAGLADKENNGVDAYLKIVDACR